MHRVSVLIEFAFVDGDCFVANPAGESSLSCHVWPPERRRIARDRPSGVGDGRLCKNNFSTLVKRFFPRDLSHFNNHFKPQKQIDFAVHSPTFHWAPTHRR